MSTVLDAVYANLDYFILMFLRVSALLVSSPIFGRRSLPNMLKISLCLLVTYVIFSSDASVSAVAYNSVLEFVMLCVMELLFGLVMGWVTTLFFSIVHTSGQVMDMQMGFGMVSVYDVQNNISVPVTGNFLNVALLVAFFGVNGHLRLIHIIASTFSFIPVGNVVLNPAIGLVALEIFALSFVLVVNVAMPLIASGLLGEVAMGFIVRAIPQMNVYVVGIPLKILLGFMMLVLLLPIYVSFTGVIFDRMFMSIDQMIAGLAA